MKNLTAILLLCVFFSVEANAFDIVNYDAFLEGDKSAILDRESGLIWLDFGINNGESLKSTIDNLSDRYADWRLPTEVEVKSLWGKFSVLNGDERLWEIFDIWGANKSPSDHLPFLSWGYFIDSDGYVGAGILAEKDANDSKLVLVDGYYDSGYVEAGVYEKIIDIKYDGSDYFPFTAEGVMEISTLLVKKSTVSESQILHLYALLILGLFLARLKS